jgi:hypothetical protein
MKWWSAVRVAGPGSIGLALVILRPSWVSVVTLGLLLIVSMWFDGQERRADDIEDVETTLREEINLLGGRVAAENDATRRLADSRVTGALEAVAGDHDRLKRRVDEMGQRLDVLAQQRKGPSL